MPRYNRDRDYDRDYERREDDEAGRGHRNWDQNMGRNVGRGPNIDRADPGREYGRQYGRHFRTSDRMNDQMNYGRTQGREADRYGMESEDWRYMDRYWRNMYGEDYPRESYSYRPPHEDDTFAGLGGPSDWMSTRNPALSSHRGRGPRNYKRSDERILEDVNEQLTRHHMIDATDIEVTVQDGEVTLRGTVDHRRTRWMAEEVADSVSGVTNVRNELKINPPHWQESRKGDRAA